MITEYGEKLLNQHFKDFISKIYALDLHFNDKTMRFLVINSKPEAGKQYATSKVGILKVAFEAHVLVDSQCSLKSVSLIDAAENEIFNEQKTGSFEPGDKFEINYNYDIGYGGE
jgi:hypothetical protein